METQIKTLVLARHLILKSISALAYEDNSNEQENAFKVWSHNLSVLSDLLHIELTAYDIINKDFDANKMMSSYLDSSVNKESIAEKIHDKYGKDLTFIYMYYTETIALQYISSFYSYGDIFSRIHPKRKRLILSELKKGDEFVKGYFESWKPSNFFLNKYLSVNAIELMIQLGKEDSDEINYPNIFEISSSLLGELFPDFQDLTFNLNTSQELIDKLNQCKPGLKYWKAYEKLGIEILQYLFRSDFDAIYPQKRTLDGHQIRDVIIPNTPDKGFWNHIRREFDSKNIVVEFKNGMKKGAEKDSLNQLRIYLSKKTIGKFGLLFVRNPPSDSLLKARRLAYEESGILILIIDDQLLRRLLVCKALTGSCNALIQKEKVIFEINY